MTDKPTTPEIFPQHLASSRRPSIVDIIHQCIRDGKKANAAFSAVRALYPNVTEAEFIAAINGEAKRIQAEDDAELAMDLVRERILGPIWSEPGNEGLTALEATRIAAERGNEDAKRLLAHFESQALRSFSRDFAAAVELDPYWEMDERGAASCRKGATYRTPEDLVNAYRAGQLGKGNRA